MVYDKVTPTQTSMRRMCVMDDSSFLSDKSSSNRVYCIYIGNLHKLMIKEQIPK